MKKPSAGLHIKIKGKKATTQVTAKPSPKAIKKAAEKAAEALEPVAENADKKPTQAGET